MPELPEVETVRRDLAGSIDGKRIEKVEILNPGSLKGAAPKSFSRMMAGKGSSGSNGGENI